ncbi:uncharacterized protein METZ01_LOCUS324553, partial [marine metagenome]
MKGVVFFNTIVSVSPLNFKIRASEHLS